MFHFPTRALTVYPGPVFIFIFHRYILLPGLCLDLRHCQTLYIILHRVNKKHLCPSTTPSLFFSVTLIFSSQAESYHLLCQCHLLFHSVLGRLASVSSRIYPLLGFSHPPPTFSFTPLALPPLFTPLSTDPPRSFSPPVAFLVDLQCACVRAPGPE